MHLDRLEPRTLLAGDVRVTRSHGDRYSIIGDDADNDVVITAVRDSTLFLIQGRNGTTIDGDVSRLVYSRDLDHFINLRGGNDRLVLNKIDFDTNVKIDLGAGNDRVYLARSLFRAVDVYGGEGADRVDVAQSTFGRRLRVFAGDGRDRTGISQTRLRRGFEVADSGRSSFVSLRDVSASQQSWVSTGNGRDWLEIFDSSFDVFSANLRGAFDEYYVRGNTFGQKRLDPGPGPAALSFIFDFDRPGDLNGWQSRVGPFAEASTKPPTPFAENAVGQSQIVDLPDDGMGPVYALQYAEGESAFLHRTLDASDGVVAGTSYHSTFELEFDVPQQFKSDAAWYVGDTGRSDGDERLGGPFDRTGWLDGPGTWGSKIGISSGTPLPVGNDGVYPLRVGSADAGASDPASGVVTTYLRSVVVTLRPQ